MNNSKLLAFAIAMLAMTNAFADPAVSATAGRSLDDKQSESLKQDKSLSADKSKGNRATWSDSNEKAIEQSGTKSHSQKRSTSLDATQSNSIDVSINSLLLRVFVQMYENQNMIPDSQVEQVFQECRPLTGIIQLYPTANFCKSNVNNMYAVEDRSFIVPRAVATRFPAGTCGNVWESDKQVQSVYDTDPHNKVVSQYGRCRIMASKWIDIAGKRVMNLQLNSETEIEGNIRAVFKQMNNDQPLFDSIVQQGKQIWSEAYCAPSISRYNEFKGVELDCGILTINGKDITVENRPTLSESGIEGRSYKVSLNMAGTESLAEDDTLAEDLRVSRNHKESDSRDRYREQKKAESLTRSKSLEKSKTNSTTRGSGSDVTSNGK